MTNKTPKAYSLYSVMIEFSSAKLGCVCNLSEGIKVVESLSVDGREACVSSIGIRGAYFPLPRSVPVRVSAGLSEKLCL